jgi:hypothetical protein
VETPRYPRQRSSVPLEFAQPRARTWAEQIGRKELLRYHYEVTLSDPATNPQADAARGMTSEETETSSRDAGAVGSEDAAATPPLVPEPIEPTLPAPVDDPLVPRNPLALDPFGILEPPFGGLP